MHAEAALTRPVPTVDPDRLLVERLAEGDESALREVCSTYARRMMAYACRLTGSVETAEEVVQDSLLAAWRAPRSYRGEGRVLAWLLGITRNRALNAVRRRRVPETSLGDAADTISRSPGPDAGVERAEIEDRMRRALRQLSREHREAIDLVFYQGLTLAEVAGVCRCPTGTVKSRLNHAKGQLRRHDRRNDGGAGVVACPVDRDGDWGRRVVQKRRARLCGRLATSVLAARPGARLRGLWRVACGEKRAEACRGNITAILPVRVYQVLFTGYWFWGNFLNPAALPTLNGTVLTPSGAFAAYAFFGASLGNRNATPGFVALNSATGADTSSSSWERASLIAPRSP